MPFGLKNIGATYQHLVNKIFKNHIKKTMEVYINDMLINSFKSEEHMEHLRQIYDNLEKYIMRLNPTKCTFRVSVTMFLKDLVTQQEKRQI